MERLKGHHVGCPYTWHLGAEQTRARARSAAVLGGARACAGLTFITMKSTKAVEDVAADEDEVRQQVRLTETCQNARGQVRTGEGYAGERLLILRTVQCETCC
jgi:hypothetical protein